MNEIKATRGFNLLGEAYQQSFDELIEKIENKGLSFMDSLILADFIKEYNIPYDVALNNINKENASRLLNCINKAEALNDACLSDKDLVILDYLIHSSRFVTMQDIKEIIGYAVLDHSIRGNRVKSVKEACSYFQIKLQEEAVNFLSFRRE